MVFSAFNVTPHKEFTDSVKYLTCTDNFCIIDLFMELFLGDESNRCYF